MCRYVNTHRMPAANEMTGNGAILSNEFDSATPMYRPTLASLKLHARPPAYVYLAMERSASSESDSSRTNSPGCTSTRAWQERELRRHGVARESEGTGFGGANGRMHNLWGAHDGCDVLGRAAEERDGELLALAHESKVDSTAFGPDNEVAHFTDPLATHVFLFDRQDDCGRCATVSTAGTFLRRAPVRIADSPSPACTLPLRSAEPPRMRWLTTMLVPLS